MAVVIRGERASGEIKTIADFGRDFVCTKTKKKKKSKHKSALRIRGGAGDRSNAFRAPRKQPPLRPPPESSRYYIYRGGSPGPARLLSRLLLRAVSVSARFRTHRSRFFSYTSGNELKDFFGFGAFLRGCRRTSVRIIIQ